MSARGCVAGLATALAAVVLVSLPAAAAGTKAPARSAPARPAPARSSPARSSPAAPAPRPPVVLPPEVYQVNPTHVNPTVQPNIMILGQHLTPTTTVSVGGRTATTVQVPDANHLMVKLPDNLSHGSYMVEVSNAAGTAVASDPLVVDDDAAKLSTLQMIAIGGALILLVLLMRLARTPALS